MGHKQMFCKISYDPFYGFKIIEVGKKVNVRPQGNGLVRLESCNNGQLLGMIDETDLYKYFN